jgi:hypothetical protein
MGKHGMSGAKHGRAGGGSRAKGRRGYTRNFQQGKPNKSLVYIVSFRRAA